uniref:Zinc carboxypeptidase A 1 n=1 Tax=Bursaphelenchus xylophilus TaxID=6326 RepID=A0A1I7S612_BURXY
MLSNSGLQQILLVLCAAIFSVQGAIEESDGKYKVYRLSPTDEAHSTALNLLYNSGEFDFWKEPSAGNKSAEIMITPAQESQFKVFLDSTKIPFQVLVEDLNALIYEKEGPNNWRSRALRFLGHGKRDAIDGDHTFGLIMGEYYSYDEIVSYMRRIVEALGGKAKMISIGRTHEGREIYGIQFGRPADKSRTVTWIDAGIHAREWTAVHTGIYMLYVVANALLNGNQPVHQKISSYLQNNDLLIFPCVNPDGYEYTRTHPELAEVRFWRKNRSPEICGHLKSGEHRCCRGVDLNRNFDFHFSAGGASTYPCSEIFHGRNAFSEPESKAIRDAVLKLGPQRLVAFISLHAYSQLVIYPYSNDKTYFPPDIDELKSLAKRAVNAIGQKYGTNYQYGSGPEIIYAYTGGSADWAKETVGIKYTYTIELRPTYTSWNGFVLDKAQLIPTARETLDGMAVMLDAVDQRSPNPHATVAPAKVEFIPAGRSLVNTQSNPPATCQDRAPSCMSWIKERPTICVDARSAMVRECKRSCSLC